MILIIGSKRSENNFYKAWQSLCAINSCESTLQECINHACFGKANCKSCVEDYKPTCSKCVDDIYDETAQFQLPGSNIKTIVCDSKSQMHTTVCNFFCRSLFKPNFKCEVISDFPVCNCIDSFTTTTTTTTKPTTPTTTTPTTTMPTTTTTTTTKNPFGIIHFHIIY